jgi:hypothetical protein
MMTHSYKRMGHFLFFEKNHRGQGHGYMERAVPLFHSGIPGSRTGLRKRQRPDFEALPKGDSFPDIYKWSKIFYFRRNST